MSTCAYAYVYIHACVHMLTRKSFVIWQCLSIRDAVDEEFLGSLSGWRRLLREILTKHASIHFKETTTLAPHGTANATKSGSEPSRCLVLRREDQFMLPNANWLKQRLVLELGGPCWGPAFDHSTLPTWWMGITRVFLKGRGVIQSKTVAHELFYVDFLHFFLISGKTILQLNDVHTATQSQPPWPHVREWLSISPVLL